MTLTESEINKLGRVVMGMLTELSIQKKCKIAAKAGLDTSKVPDIQSNPPVNNALFKAFEELGVEDKQTAMGVIADELVAYQPSEQAGLVRLLSQHGYKYLSGKFERIRLVDEREKAFVPPSAAEQLSEAFDRLADGDEDGAITAASGAVDTVTNAIYKSENLGQPPNSLQAKVNTVLDRLNIYGEMLEDLKQIGLKPEDAQEIVQELHSATKHAANALQVIRRSLGDVHGKKPTYTRLTYDSLKWASAICGLLEGKA